ncbi:hypothetical protein DMC30DRAFT_103797 [Rhodotorula diobovata]|uniref:Uncharacterized protein n=1 Tax=Rhodotorula diobovata TaxID=5288 RepID=A0A5C5FL41_9BASI|nr:hypothetical protein DMC30DRAFT_103797 [Rhodotorula diobovata]
MSSLRFESGHGRKESRARARGACVPSWRTPRGPSVRPLRTQVSRAPPFLPFALTPVLYVDLSMNRRRSASLSRPYFEPPVDFERANPLEALALAGRDGPHSLSNSLALDDVRCEAETSIRVACEVQVQAVRTRPAVRIPRRGGRPALHSSGRPVPRRSTTRMVPLTAERDDDDDVKERNPLDDDAFKEGLRVAGYLQDIDKSRKTIKGRFSHALQKDSRRTSTPSSRRSSSRRAASTWSASRGQEPRRTRLTFISSSPRCPGVPRPARSTRTRPMAPTRPSPRGRIFRPLRRRPSPSGPPRRASSGPSASNSKARRRSMLCPWSTGIPPQTRVSVAEYAGTRSSATRTSMPSSSSARRSKQSSCVTTPSATLCAWPSHRPSRSIPRLWHDGQRDRRRATPTPRRRPSSSATRSRAPRRPRARASSPPSSSSARA